MLEIDRWQRSFAHLLRRRNRMANKVALHFLVDFLERRRTVGIVERACFASESHVRVGLKASGGWFIPDLEADKQGLGLMAVRLGTSSAFVPLTSGVPMYFRVPRMPPVSILPAVLIPRSQARSISSCRSRIDGTLPGKYS